ncbi:Spy/CpxP family protein refolding chaperone [Magnetospirillum molischianum]|uniref:LTXXQ motif family protein n=1 Tax=Magnetospirillum molischianum DSM 120 TaxID=1150626 RepID=H8FQ35_MAGML|nr:Spy/CpxP family protein refolding chaperone [Magnetospirillum molischianum]CCG40473.1 exported hypothetical protein [Magnetospirillum molischianum DSM 120]
MVKPSRALLFTLPLVWSSLALAEPTSPGKNEPVLTQQDLTARHVKACDDHYAHRGGELGYQEARLKLTEPQKSAFAKYRQDSLAAAETIRTACHANGPKAGVKPTVLEREASKEAHLKLELQSLQETRPALEAFYATLTPSQKETFDREPSDKDGKAGKSKASPHEKN